MDSRVFLITGASTGIGAATARAAVGPGHRVVSRRAAGTSSTRSPRSSAGGTPPWRSADVTEWADNEAAVQRALDAFGRLDVVFANAGFGAKRGWLEESPEQWRSMVLTNVLGAAYTVAPRSRR
jgi:NAD(P)-dependent dehydrogenase (short-subunit alcohol dehydrogenase family)